MKLYLTVIGIAMLVISILNILFNTASWYYVIILVTVCTALQGKSVLQFSELHVFPLKRG